MIHTTDNGYRLVTGIGQEQLIQINSPESPELLGAMEESIKEIKKEMVELSDQFDLPFVNNNGWVTGLSYKLTDNGSVKFIWNGRGYGRSIYTSIKDISEFEEVFDKALNRLLGRFTFGEFTPEMWEYFSRLRRLYWLASAGVKRVDIPTIVSYELKPYEYVDMWRYK